MKTEDFKVKWLEVTCPICLSMKGQGCVISKGKRAGNKMIWPHSARVKKAKKAL